MFVHLEHLPLVKVPPKLKRTSEHSNTVAGIVQVYMILCMSNMELQHMQLLRKGTVVAAPNGPELVDNEQTEHCPSIRKKCSSSISTTSPIK